MGENQRLIVGISGASGAIYGIRLLELLRPLRVETHLVMSRTAEITIGHETGWKIDAVKALADHVHAPTDLAAAISSGSFRTSGMVIAPCSVRTLGEIATGISSSLLTRAADVVLKERRRLVLLVRETPLHAVHLRNMVTVADLGAIVAPPVPAFYSRPKTIEDIVDHTVGRVLDLFDLDAGVLRRWGEKVPGRDR
jgi:4-hydroxy-3-polyprenylbenzoate decarboxylase